MIIYSVHVLPSGLVVVVGTGTLTQKKNDPGHMS